MKKIFIVIMVLMFSTAAFSAEYHFDSVSEISDYIYDLCNIAPNRKIVKNRAYRDEFANDIHVAAHGQKIPELLFVGKIYNESSFRTGIKNGRQHGLGQMQGVSQKGCDMSSRLGELECSARWLRVCKTKCGTWEGALTCYGTNGGVCSAVDSKNKDWAVKLRLWRTINKQMVRWMKAEQQRQNIRKTIIDDLEYMDEINENST